MLCNVGQRNRHETNGTTWLTARIIKCLANVYREKAGTKIGASAVHVICIIYYRKGKTAD